MTTQSFIFKPSDDLKYPLDVVPRSAELPYILQDALHKLRLSGSTMYNVRRDLTNSNLYFVTVGTIAGEVCIHAPRDAAWCATLMEALV